MTDAMWKAVLDLVALVLIWGGTLVITLGGVPALIGPTMRTRDGARIVRRDGVILTGRPDPDAVEARRRYMRWAVPGVVLITLGMVWQAVEPVRALLPITVAGRP